MKYTATLIVMASMLLFSTNCNNPSADKLCKDDESRGKIISELVNNHDYMNQVMDSVMQNKYGMELMARNHDMKGSMMSGQSMMNMMKSDTSMHRMMMDMMDKDSAFCSKMGNLMMENPNMKNMMKDKMIKDGYIMDKHNNMK
jgi:hypothetical protein